MFTQNSTKNNFQHVMLLSNNYIVSNNVLLYLAHMIVKNHSFFQLQLFKIGNFDKTFIEPNRKRDFF